MSNINFFEIFIISLRDPVNLIFFIIIIVLFLTDLIKKKDLKAQIVSVGVLGTFIGIFLGLQSFNPADMKNSINHILDGLKTAFFTSIIGMLAASSLAIYQRMMNRDIDDEKSKERILSEISLKLDDNTEIVKELRRLNLTQDKFGNEISLKLDKNVEIVEELKELNLAKETFGEEIKKVSQSIYELKENSNKENQELISILNINFEKMNSSLEIAIEQLSKGATEEIINALKQVIEDFNHELQSQFGENFIKLNESVINLLQWQENYKTHIEVLESKLTLSTSSIEKSKDSLSIIASKNNDIFKVYTNLEDIINTYREQVNDLNKHLRTYSELSKGAKNMFSSIESNISSTQSEFSNLSQSIKITNVDISNSFKTNKRQLDIIGAHFRTMGTEIPKSLQVSLSELDRGLATLTNKFKKDFDKILQEHRRNMQ